MTRLDPGIWPFGLHGAASCRVARDLSWPDGRAVRIADIPEVCTTDLARLSPVSRLPLSNMPDEVRPQAPRARGRVAKDAPRKVLRTTVIFSSVAVAATGGRGRHRSRVHPGDATAPPHDGGPVAAPLSARRPRERGHLVSRSDRRDAGRPGQGGGAVPADGPAVTRTEDLPTSDPRDDRQGAARRVRLLLGPVRLPRLPLTRRERLARRRRQPDVVGVRHPAGAARAPRWPRPAPTGPPTRSPRSAGAWATSRTATAALRRLGPQPVRRLVLTRRPDVSRSSGMALASYDVAERSAGHEERDVAGVLARALERRQVRADSLVARRRR